MSSNDGTSQKSKTLLRTTGVVYDERMLEHRCLWEDHPECPERLSCVLERCTELGLLDRCFRIPSRLATQPEIVSSSLHTQRLYTELASICENGPPEALEEFASHYDSIYVHPTTFDAVRLACGSTLALVDSILKGEILNGMAIVRPPGHHAMRDEHCGFSFFNNIALSTRSALDSGLANKILIVDFDVHHGQATQQMFYEDPRVLYFSTHRYEFGTFWPHLRESDFNWIGQEAGLGFNCNVPLNAVGMGNTEFLTVWHQLLLPIAHQFNPDLVLVSAGYDSALNDPKGEMRLTPQCYPHLISPLMGLASGRVGLVLEGGYCLKALAEGAALSLRTLLGDPCPVISPIGNPSSVLTNTIWNSFSVLQNYWDFPVNSAELHVPSIQYDFEKLPKPDKYPTRNQTPENESNAQSVHTSNETEMQLESLISSTKLEVPLHRFGIMADEKISEVNFEADNFHRTVTLNELVQDVISGVCQFGIISGMMNSVDVPSHALKTGGVSRILQLRITGNENEDDVIEKAVVQDTCSNMLRISIGSGNKFLENSEMITDLNKFGLKLSACEEGDYLALCTSVILPIAYEFGPDLVLLNVTSAAPIKIHELCEFIHLLSALAQSRLIIAVGNRPIRQIIQEVNSRKRYTSSRNCWSKVSYKSETLIEALNKYSDDWSVLRSFRKPVIDVSERDGVIELGVYADNIHPL